MQLQAAGKIVTGRYRGWPAYLLRTEECTATVVPYLGGKVASLVDHRTGREFLTQPESDPVIAPGADVRFVESDPFGFDDMFPTILAGQIVIGNGQVVTLPDHGEVWSRAWQHESNGDGIVLSIDGVTLPYRMTKRCAMSDARTLRIDYTVTNLGSIRYDALWAAHPLVQCSDAVEIDLPPGDVVSVYNGSHHYGDHGMRSRWKPLSLPPLAPGQRPQAHKFYTADADQAREFSLRFPATRERLSLRFGSDEPAYFGLWHEDRADGTRVIAPEPCTGGYDRPDLARRYGQPCSFGPHERKRWRVELEISQY